MWTNSRFGGIGPDGKEEKMLISVILVGFVLWLFSKCVGLALRMTWGLAKLTGVVLMTVALPLAGICAFLGLGLFLLLPVGLLLLALGLLGPEKLLQNLQSLHAVYSTKIRE